MAARRPLDWLLLALALGWLAAVTVIQVAGIGLTVPDISASPETLVAGDVGRLLSSSLLVADELRGAQIALLAAATALVLLRHGPRLWWLAALAGHVGSALVAYALIAGGIALGFGSAERIADDWDYGISCVFAALLGVLFADAVRRLRAGRGGRLDRLLLVAIGLVALLSLMDLDWYGIEHPIAFGLGAAVLVWWERRATAAGSGAPAL